MSLNIELTNQEIIFLKELLVSTVEISKDSISYNSKTKEELEESLNDIVNSTKILSKLINV